MLPKITPFQLQTKTIMKHLYYCVLFLSLQLSTQAQVQNGTVREINSNKSPISGAQIHFADAVPTTSDQNGIFRLAFKGKKAGDLIFYEEIYKKGYELVNEKELQVLKISSKERLTRDIILAKTGVIQAAKKEYYQISDHALLAGFQKEKKALQQQLQQSSINQGQYLQQFQQLQEQYELQKEALDALAEKFARVNFDDASELYAEALRLFKAGDIEACQKKLEDANLLSRTDQRLHERKRIDTAQKILDEQETDKAEKIYDQLLRIDSNNLEILQEAAEFFQTYHFYDKALQVYPTIIAHPKIEIWQKANAYGHIGEIQTTKGDLPKALNSYTLVSEMYDSLHQNTPTYSLYKQNLSVSYSKLGSTHSSLGNLDKALTFFEERSRLGEELYESYPQNVSFKNGLAISYSKLGRLYEKIGDDLKRKEYLKKAKEIWKELASKYSNYVEFQNNLKWAENQLKE